MLSQVTRHLNRLMKQRYVIMTLNQDLCIYNLKNSKQNLEFFSLDFKDLVLEVGTSYILLILAGLLFSYALTVKTNLIEKGFAVTINSNTIDKVCSKFFNLVASQGYAVSTGHALHSCTCETLKNCQLYPRLNY